VVALYTVHFFWTCREVLKQRGKKRQARDLPQLREVREAVRRLAAERATPKAIVDHIRELAVVKNIMEFADGRNAPVKYDRTLVAAAILEPWLPVSEIPRREILRIVFRRKGGMKNTLNRSQLTVPEIMLAADWVKRSGLRTVPATEKLKAIGAKLFRFRWLLRGDGFYCLRRIPYGYRPRQQDDAPLDWSPSDLNPKLAKELEENTALEGIFRSLELRYNPDKGDRARRGALLVIRGMAADTARRRAGVDLTPGGWQMLLRNPILCGIIDDRVGGLSVLKTDKSILSGSEFVTLQTTLTHPLAERTIVGHRKEEDQPLIAAAIQKLTDENKEATPLALAEYLGIGSESIRQTVRRMAKAGSIVRLTYRISGQGAIAIYGLPRENKQVLATAA